MSTNQQNKKKTGVIGTVVRARVPKMVTVVVVHHRPHPMYGKIIRHRTRIHAHDDVGAKEGEMVRMVEIRPMSRLKQFNVVEIMK